MTLIEIVVLVASVITSLSVIITAVVTAYKFIRKWDKWVKQKDKHDIEQYVQILRLVIMSPEMPLSERIAAGLLPYHEDYDFNKDGVVDEADVTWLRKFILNN